MLISSFYFYLMDVTRLNETVSICSLFKIKQKIHFNPKTVFWTNVGKIVLILFLKNTSLDLSGTRLGYFS